MIKFAPLLLILLAGCASTQEAPERVLAPVRVLLPVAVGCVPPNLGGAPAYEDTAEKLLAAVGVDGRYKLLIAGREQRIARLNELEPVVAACPKAP